MSVSTIPFVKIYEEIMSARKAEIKKSSKQSNIVPSEKGTRKTWVTRFLEKKVSDNYYHDVWVLFNNNA